MSCAALVDDASFAVEQLGLAPAVVIGQSFGGLTALLLAARRPDLVRGLVVAEASPAHGESVVAEVAGALRAWPDPRFDVDVLVRMLRDATSRSYWEEVEIPGAGHDLHLERPTEWRQVVTEFLSRVR